MKIASFDLISHHDSHALADHSRLDFSIQSVDRRGFVACHGNPFLFAYWKKGERECFRGRNGIVDDVIPRKVIV